MAQKSIKSTRPFENNAWQHTKTVNQDITLTLGTRKTPTPCWRRRCGNCRKRPYFDQRPASFIRAQWICQFFHTATVKTFAL